MKKLFCLCLLLFVAVSCDRTNNVELKRQLDQKIKSELASGKKNDSILLGFYFGMPQHDFNERFMALLKEKKIRLDDKGLFHYTLGKCNSEDRDAIISADFYNDSLYQFDLAVEKGYYDYPRNIAELLKPKYGEPLMYNRDSEHDWIYDYAWINGNRLITVERYDSIYECLTLRYTDLVLLEKKKLQKAKLERDKEMQDSINDLEVEKSTIRDL